MRGVGDSVSPADACGGCSGCTTAGPALFECAPLTATGRSRSAVEVLPAGAVTTLLDQVDLLGEGGAARGRGDYTPGFKKFKIFLELSGWLGYY